jgi:hypothetical protein
MNANLHKRDHFFGANLTHFSMAQSLMLACLTTATFVVPEASADVWKVSPVGARQGAHYLINTETSAVSSMRDERCVKSFSGKLTKDAAGVAKTMVVDSEIGGGNGPRGTQKMTFNLREGTADLSVESSYRGAQRPLSANYSIVCKGKSCTIPTCD